MTGEVLAPLRVTAVLCAWNGLLALVTANLISPAAGFAAGVVTTLMSMSCAFYVTESARLLRRRGGLVVLALTLTYVAAHFDAGGDVTALAGTLPPLLIGVLAAQALGGDKRHDLMVLVTVGEFMLVLAAGLSPTPWLAVPVFAGWVLAVVAIVQSHQLHSAECSTPALQSAVPLRIRALRPAATATALVLAIGLLLFLVVPPPSGTAAQRRLRAATSGAGSSSQGGRSAAHYLGDQLDMRTRGDLGNTPVADVPDDSPPLWRSRIYESFDGVQWTAEEGPPILVGRGRVVLPPDPLDHGVAPARATRTDDVRTLRGFNGHIFAPGTPVAVTTAGRVGVMPAARTLISADADYSVTSALPQTDPLVLATASGNDDERWLQLPPALPDRVAVLARDIAGNAHSRPAAVDAIAAYLGGAKSYDLKSPVPPPGADAVDHFLFEAPSGFCEQFAAAQVVLLRTLGIPARMATGYGYGAPQSEGRRRFTSANAHAWVEVWYPGIGWSPSDPTPPSVQDGTNRANLLTRFAKWVQRVLSTTRGRLTLAGIIVLVAAAWFAIIWWRRRRPAPAPSTTPGALASTLLASFARLEAALAADGRPRAPAETLSELQSRLGADPTGRRALETLELACYSPHLVSPQDSRTAAQIFDQLAASILSAHASRERLAASIGVGRS